MIQEAAYRAGMQTLFAAWEQRQGVQAVTRRRQTDSVFIDHTAGFIRDGVVCPSRWFSQAVRPLFLLKEAYGEGHWDLIADHLCRPYRISQMWRRVSQWTYGLLETTPQTLAPYGGWEPILQNDNPYLRQAAVVNVKKSGGRSSSDLDEIRAYASFDRAFLYDQLALCDPTVIVCGYTASVLDLLFSEPVRQVRQDNLFYHVRLNNHPVLVLDYWHPANQYPDLMNYYGLIGAYQQALLAHA